MRATKPSFAFNRTRHKRLTNQCSWAGRITTAFSISAQKLAPALNSYEDTNMQSFKVVFRASTIMWREQYAGKVPFFIL
jgi:hypothetical protein